MQAGNTPTAENQFAGMVLPNVTDMSLQLEQLVQQGVITPEQAKASLVGQSDMNNISTDPKLRQAQMDALGGLQEVSKAGLTDSDKANLNQIRTEEDTAARGKTNAILQNAQARGMGGSGMELMANLQNAQDSATRGSQRDMGIAGQAQDRALQALIQGGQMGGQMQSQEFGQKAQVAGANDAISKFNAQNQQQTNMANTQANNATQAANLAATQGVSNANVNMRNQQQQYNKGLVQQNFDNQYKRAGGAQGVANTNAMIQGQNSQNSANATNQMIGAGLTMVNPFLGAAAGAATPKKTQQQAMATGGIVDGMPTGMDSEPRMLQPGEAVIRKEDVPDLLAKAHTDKHGKFDAAGFLDTITGHKYGYKKGSK